jgi:protein transport protein SEC61 subunit beta
LIHQQTSFVLFCFDLFFIFSNCFCWRLHQFIQSGRGAQRKARAAAANMAAAAGNRAGGGATGILRFYAEDSPGLQLGPTQVLMMSVSFVGIVVLLHIWGKFRS